MLKKISLIILIVLKISASIFVLQMGKGHFSAKADVHTVNSLAGYIDNLFFEDNSQDDPSSPTDVNFCDDTDYFLHTSYTSIKHPFLYTFNLSLKNCDEKVSTSYYLHIISPPPEQL